MRESERDGEANRPAFVFCGLGPGGTRMNVADTVPVLLSETACGPHCLLGVFHWLVHYPLSPPLEVCAFITPIS